jgi:hypothetical protein
MKKVQYTLTNLKQDLYGIISHVEIDKDIVILTRNSKKVCAIVPIEYITK